MKKKNESNHNVLPPKRIQQQKTTQKISFSMNRYYKLPYAFSGIESTGCRMMLIVIGIDAEQFNMKINFVFVVTNKAHRFK